MRGTTPAAPGDVGEPDPTFAAALLAGDVGEVLGLLAATRLIVPVVALPATGEAEMAVPELVNADGGRALPVFTGVASLRAWRDDARPVPMSGRRVLLAAADGGYDGIVIDVAGPAPCVIQGEVARALAAAIVGTPEGGGC